MLRLKVWVVGLASPSGLALTTSTLAGRKIRHPRRSRQSLVLWAVCTGVGRTRLGTPPRLSGLGRRRDRLPATIPPTSVAYVAVRPAFTVGRPTTFSLNTSPSCASLVTLTTTGRHTAFSRAEAGRKATTDAPGKRMFYTTLTIR